MHRFMRHEEGELFSAIASLDKAKSQEKVNLSLARVIKWLMVGADIDAVAPVSLRPIEKSDTPLMTAVRIRSLDAVKLLTEYGANLDIQDENGYTALMLALNINKSIASERLLSIQCHLIENNANLSIRSHYGMNPPSAMDMINNLPNTTEFQKLKSLAEDKFLAASIKQENQDFQNDLNF